VHLHACVTDGVFVPAAAASAGDGHGSEGCYNAKQQLRTPGPLLPRLTSRSSARRPLRRCH
jgi:hypothetical protein